MSESAKPLVVEDVLTSIRRLLAQDPAAPDAGAAEGPMTLEHTLAALEAAMAGRPRPEAEEARPVPEASGADEGESIVSDATEAVGPDVELAVSSTDMLAENDSRALPEEASPEVAEETEDPRVRVEEGLPMSVAGEDPDDEGADAPPASGAADDEAEAGSEAEAAGALPDEAEEAPFIAVDMPDGPPAPSFSFRHTAEVRRLQLVTPPAPSPEAPDEATRSEAGPAGPPHSARNAEWPFPEAEQIAPVAEPVAAAHEAAPPATGAEAGLSGSTGHAGAAAGSGASDRDEDPFAEEAFEPDHAMSRASAVKDAPAPRASAEVTGAEAPAGLPEREMPSADSPADPEARRPVIHRAGRMTSGRRGGEAPYSLFDETDDLPIDMDVLRRLVADILRQELQGALGERVTRNVRKLVRAEIRRALAEDDEL